MAAASVLALLLAAAAPGPVREVPQTAQRFVCYLQALDAGGQPMTFWDRVTYSLVLAGGNPKVARPRARG